MSTKHSLDLKDNAVKSSAVADNLHDTRLAPALQKDSWFSVWPKKTVRLGAQILLPVVVIAIALGLYQYMKATKPPARVRAAQEIVFPIRSKPVQFINNQPILTLYGTTVAGRQVELRALVAGKVRQTGPQLMAGGEVKAGDTLLEIDAFDYEVDLSEAKSQLAEARAKLIETEASLEVERGNLTSAREQLQLARTDLNRAQTLGTRGTISKRTVDDRRLVLSQRQQTVTQLENSLKVWSARKTQQQATVSRLETVLARARKRLAETRLKAPFNSYVSDVGAQVGRMLSVNDRVATLIDRDWIDVRFSIADRQFGRLAADGAGVVGRPLQVIWDVGSKKLSYTAKIERIDARVEAKDGGIQVYGRIEMQDDAVPIRPGVFVEIRLQDIEYRNVVKVPSEALYDGNDNGPETNNDRGSETAGDEKYVYVIVDGQLRKRRVTVVGASGQDFLIRGDIQPGERIMVTRLSRPGEECA